MTPAKVYANSVEQFAKRDEETRLLQMIAAGDTNKEIANKVDYGEDTIKRLVGAVSARWGAPGRTNLVYRACTSGRLVVGRSRVELGLLPADEYETQRDSLIGLLSPQQIVVLPMIADGLTSIAIGESIYMSEQTVKGYIKDLLDQLRARNRPNLVYTACLHGLLPWGEPDA